MGAIMLTWHITANIYLFDLILKECSRIDDYEHDGSQHDSGFFHLFVGLDEVKSTAPSYSAAVSHDPSLEKSIHQ